MKTLTNLSLGLLVGLSLTTCQEGTWIGEELIDEDNTQVQQVDTLTVRSASVLLDSLYTTNGNRLLAGAYTDPALGAVQAQCFFTVDSSGAFSIEDEATLVYDSLSLSLYHDYEYPRTDHVQYLSVFTLAQPLDDEKLYFNHSNPIPTERHIGTARFHTRTTRGQRFHTRLDDDLGLALFQLAKGQHRLPLEELLPGLSMQQPTNQTEQSILGFPSDSVYLRLYYHDKKDDEAKTTLLRLKPSYRFNRLTSDRSQTNLSRLTQRGVPIASSLTKDQTYIQAGVGICTKIDFPTLRSIRQNRQISLNVAYLEIEPQQLSSTAYAPLENLYVYTPSHKQTLQRAYWSGNAGNPVSVTRTVDPLSGDSKYRIYLTQYVHDILAQDTDEYAGILLYTPAATTGVNEVGRTILPAQGRSREGIKLHVLFTVIK